LARRDRPDSVTDRHQDGPGAPSRSAGEGDQRADVAACAHLRIEYRRSSDRGKLPYVVRVRIDGRERSRSFRTKTEADRYRAELLKAVRDGERFDDATGEPEAWQLPLSDMGVHEWTRRWLTEQWPEWQPRTRTSTVESLSRFVALAVGDRSAAPGG
jgi:hypothetical protein